MELNDTCKRINTYGQSSSSIIIGYEGIPQNLILNVITSIIFILMFLIIRKLAWRYSQSALVKTSEESQLLKKHRDYNVWSQFFYGNLWRHRSSVASLDDEAGAEAQNTLTRQSSNIPKVSSRMENDFGLGHAFARSDSIEQQNQGLLKGMMSFIRLTDEDIGSVAGKDAVRYIKLQRYMFVYLLIVLVLALSIVLPLNLHGTRAGQPGDFVRTTITNVQGDSLSLWVHAILSGAYMLLAALFMCHYSRHVVSYDVYSVNRSCLMIKNVPTSTLDEMAIREHFREAYPNVIVEKINFVFDISKLQKLHDESLFVSAVLQVCREEAAAAQADATNEQRQSSLSFSESKSTTATTGNENAESLDSRVPVMRCPCTWLCRGCCCGTEDAVSYYARRLEQLSQLLAQETENARRHQLPVIFVEFSSPHDAANVLADFRHAKGHICGLFPFARHWPSRSSRSETLNVNAWSACYAPYPEDLNWQNLGLATSSFWYLRAFIINVILVLVLFFFTTPIYLINTLRLNRISATFQRNFATQFLPTVFMWLFSVLLPLVVYFSDVFIQHWSKSSEHYAIMVKCTVFQLLMILILPSFGLVRANELVKWLFSMSDEKSYNAMQIRWHCVFASENASFFVNYVITMSLIGSCADLLRFSELIVYTFHWMSARSSAEAKLAYKKVQWENQYGFNLSWMLCIFGIVMTYANVAPLILVFGILYMIMKMVVDRYNIYYVYLPSVMDRDVHRLSQSLVLVCVFLGVTFILGYFLLNDAYLQKMSSRTMFMIFVVVVSLGYIFSRTIVNLLKKAGCFEEQSFDAACVENCDKLPYVPKVLMKQTGNNRQQGTGTD